MIITPAQLQLQVHRLQLQLEWHSVANVESFTAVSIELTRNDIPLMIHSNRELIAHRF